MADDRHRAWERYLSTVRLGGTREERQFSFDRWWKLEKADSIATTKSDLSKGKRKIAEAVR